MFDIPIVRSDDLERLRGTFDKLLYWTPFYWRDSAPKEPRAMREARRALVTTYVPHTFRNSERQSGLCAICTFPFADAACAVGVDFEASTQKGRV